MFKTLNKRFDAYIHSLEDFSPKVVNFSEKALVRSAFIIMPLIFSPQIYQSIINWEIGVAMGMLYLSWIGQAFYMFDHLVHKQPHLLKGTGASWIPLSITICFLWYIELYPRPW